MSNGTAKYQRLSNTAKDVYNERGCCGVIAVAIYCNVSFGQARAALERAGRKHGHGTTVSQLVSAVKELDGVELVLDKRTPTDKFTVNGAPEALSDTRRAMLLTRGHVAAMIDGVVHDYTQGRRHRVIGTLTEASYL